MKKRKVGDLVSGGGSSSSDECTEAQVSKCRPIPDSTELHVTCNSVPKAIELARTLKPDDAMRVRANDVKVDPCITRPSALCVHACCVCVSVMQVPSCSHLTTLFKGAEFWGGLESVFRPFESRDLEFLRTSATLDEDSAMRVLATVADVDMRGCLLMMCPRYHLFNGFLFPPRRTPRAKQRS
jgi:hypothetical protein